MGVPASVQRIAHPDEFFQGMLRVLEESEPVVLLALGPCPSLGPDDSGTNDVESVDRSSGIDDDVRG